MENTTRALIVAAAIAVITPAVAQRYERGTGPVVEACQQDIEKLCAAKEHGRGNIRSCLEANKTNVSATCAAALDSTGPSRRR